MSNRLKICLACSGGGHLRQLLLLRDFLSNHDVFLITARTPLAESVAGELRVEYVEDIALGLLKKSPKAWWAFLKNLLATIRILARERPDVVLSSGAGTALNAIFCSRLLGSRCIFLETFAHSQTPSLTGRLAARWVNAHLVQWKALLERFPSAVLVSPLEETGEVIPPKPPEIRQVLVTVGTHGPFDRLVREVDHLIETGVLTDPVVAQAGRSLFQSFKMRCFESCGQDEMKNLLRESRLLITHAGTGSILSGLEAGCRVIAIPRRASEGEHYDDHQFEILQEMVSRGAILGGNDPTDLERLVGQAESFRPMRIRISTERIEAELTRLFEEWFGS